MPLDFANPANLALLEDLYTRWQDDPASVEPQWQQFFSGFALGLEQAPGAMATSSEAPAARRGGRIDQQRVDSLIYAYRDVGHTICRLDPLDLYNENSNPELELTTHNLSEADLDREFSSDAVPGLGSRATLRSIVEHLRGTYCSDIGAEFMHIQDGEQRRWVLERMERNHNQSELSADKKHRALMKVAQAEMFESFIHTKFLGQKRFSLEGGESMIAAIDGLIDQAGELGVKEVVMGMAHRGRLNVLSNILNKSYEEIFTEFEGSYDIADLQGDGDVKYHLGFSSDFHSSTGKVVHLTLTANPSHLEAVDPVVLGRVRGKQRQHDDTVERSKVVPVIIHGDAAFAGQGLVMECFQMSQLEGYRTGGTVHIVLNNQIGFTTLPQDARSTRYCTDIAKMVDAPVFHVNGDDVEAVVRCCQLAIEYRQQFKRDVVVDIVCYRRYGHNETDEPNYTQPVMYARINSHPRISKVYSQSLIEHNQIDPAEVDAIESIMRNQLSDALNTIKLKPAKITRSRFKGVWTGLTNTYSHAPVETGVADDALQLIGKALSTWPGGFNIHPKIKRMVEERGRVIAARENIEWALAELLSFGSLLIDGTPVRLSGQDCRRGTFSQRHSYWYDVQSRERYRPMDHLCPGQARFCVYNSPLSEAGVLGFDYGYSISEPKMLILWEAQFGDFVNGAQVIIDQFLTSSESKWGRVSGLVMLLPHGQEGMGPEHSSARLERFLTACAEDNIQVAYCSTAAQHFHILRRQMKRNFRKPLILMTPKSHLRSKEASSPYQELVEGRFYEVLDDPAAPAPSKVKRVVVCTGKVAHELMTRRNEEAKGTVAIVRVEQLYPFPDEQLQTVFARYGKATSIVWCQEEPQNMGAWAFIEPQLRAMVGHDIVFAGREAAASTAPGSVYLHQIEQETLISAALDVPARKLGAAKVGAAH